MTKEDWYLTPTWSPGSPRVKRRLHHLGLHVCFLDPVSETMAFTIYKKFLENLVGKKMEHDFLDRSGGQFPGAMEHVQQKR